MIVLRPYPWAFVILGCVFSLFAPSLLRRFRRARYRVSLHHLLVAVLLAAVLALSATLFVRSVYAQETMLQLWGRAEPGTWDDTVVLATVVHTPAPTLYFELVRRSFAPIVVAMVASFALDWYRHRRSPVA